MIYADKTFNFMGEILDQVLVVFEVIRVNVGKFEIQNVKVKKKYLINLT